MNRKFLKSALVFLPVFFITVHAEQHVYLLHGLGRTRLSMFRLSIYLKNNGFNVKNWGYNSRTETIPAIAEKLGKELEKIPAADSVCFVTHSMGGIVVRSFIASRKLDKRFPFFYRFVMMAPPNRGSKMADILSSNQLANWIFGPSLSMLRTDSASYVRTLGQPSCEFGIIAGGKGNGKGYNRLLPGDNDGIVSVETTKLDSMKNFLYVRSMHTFIMEKTIVRKNIVSFLKTGKFVK